MKEQLLKAQQLRQKLKEIIDIASKVEHNLANRLRAIQQPIKKNKDGEIARKKYLLKALEEILTDAEFWLVYRLSSPEEQQLIRDLLSPIESYWYFELFYNWLQKHDENFDKWKSYMIRGDFLPNDAKLIGAIGRQINKGRKAGKDSKYSNADLLSKIIADHAIKTDVIVVGSKANSLCVQLTHSANKNTQSKCKDWKNALIYWEIKRGLFASYNPTKEEYINALTNCILSESNSSESPEYKKVNIE